MATGAKATFCVPEVSDKTVSLKLGESFEFDVLELKVLSAGVRPIAVIFVLSFYVLNSCFLSGHKNVILLQPYTNLTSLKKTHLFAFILN